jgi:integrase
MARPKDEIEIDFSLAHDLTAGLIARAQCPKEKAQVFLRDRKAPGLRVRLTSTGNKAYTFEAKLDRQTIRRTIGDVRSWTLEGARNEANQMRVQVDGGNDPRELARQAKADKDAQSAQETARAITVGVAWHEYVEERKSRWGELHYRDHIQKAKAGGDNAIRGTRGKGATKPGPLFPLMQMKLGDITTSVISDWAAKEAAIRPTVARLSWRLLRGFLNWCAEHPVYASVVPNQNPAKAKAVREVVGRPKAKQDCLQREQLPAWFDAVKKLTNVHHVAYLQALLLTGARPGELLELRWQDVNMRWKGMTIRDKIEGAREIPLTPYVAQLLDGLPRVNEWVFASMSKANQGQSCHMSTPQNAHDRAGAVAGIDGLTLHGLRRSFKSLTEWLEVPAGVVAQLMGHKPSATAEKHYTVRPLDLLRMHHERIEAWLLQQAHVWPQDEASTATAMPRPIDALSKVVPLRRPA